MEPTKNKVVDGRLVRPIQVKDFGMDTGEDNFLQVSFSFQQDPPPLMGFGGERVWAMPPINQRLSIMLTCLGGTLEVTAHLKGDLPDFGGPHPGGLPGANDLLNRLRERVEPPLRAGEGLRNAVWLTMDTFRVWMRDARIQHHYELDHELNVDHRFHLQREEG